MAHAHTDSHGHDSHGDHGHKIVGPIILRSVLAILLVFTVLTVGQAQFEQWFQGQFDFMFPKWVNIVVVMAIASVKAALVMAYFMQLRYDNPLNTMIMAFCYFAVVIFIGFTSMDLLTRDRVTPWKSGPVVAGGTITPVKVARDRFQTAFFTKAEYVENRLVARQLDTYAHDIAARADFLKEDAAADAIAASEAVSHVAGHIRDTMINKKPKAGARRHAAELLEAAAAKASGGAGALINEAARRLASEEPPADSEAAMKADFAAIEAHSHSHGHAAHHEDASSTRNKTRGRSGVSGALDTAPGQHHDQPAHTPAPASSGH